jgi:uncharacterized cofD-like protein
VTSHLVHSALRRREGAQPVSTNLRVVTLGGGTGLPIVLSGLKSVMFRPGRGRLSAADRRRLTAIVTTADDGGSSGRLRRAYRVLPPGDIRNCLLALADGDPTMRAVFRFRFDGRGEVGGHSLGNLILTALSQMEQDFAMAAEQAGRMLEIRGSVLPSTAQDVSIVAEFHDGSWVIGESRIASMGRPILRVRLQPEDARALPDAVGAISQADLIVIGPGSLYTSLIPVLLLKDLAGAIAHSHARVVLLLNLMTEPGETDGFIASDLVRAIRRHAPAVTIHDVLANKAPIAAALLETYQASGSTPVAVDDGALFALGSRLVERDLLDPGAAIRHNPHKVARALVELAASRSTGGSLPSRRTGA